MIVLNWQSVALPTEIFVHIVTGILVRVAPITLLMADQWGSYTELAKRAH
jgi:hypothetical protein